MSLLRNTALRTGNSLRSAPTLAMRSYATGPESSGTGATANSKGFKQREQGEEQKYIREAEAEKLKKLRETLAKQRSHLDDVEAAINDLGGNSGNQKQ
ncbi:hypothetical protein BDZ90DRAFT_233449 [Jaminaea rosea]|uniref:ATPase inhibitor, mitochondrial n=1 Tax=Jaminaea rosea TaxID=1569628 RepID=A0A316UMX4_9BASI|nr:hypothetical protein BDZ90DRAFT_233449 [Jaminaea rosea]PWN26314.1 hypothetical protein BDZ90DRAFT_233449 [Jaminaea rosea]